MKAVAFLIAARLDLLNRNRPLGKMSSIIESYLAESPGASVKIPVHDLFTPIIISLENHAALVGANNPNVYKRLITKDACNPYKIFVRPITEDDLK
ncbi:MAG: hypothetical protein LBE09_02775 [Christensenellaceae bacterium]|nr:hypothetical protein [Christensenellaceae bacterium]